MTSTLPPVGRLTVKVLDCIGRPTFLVSECVEVLTLSELKTVDNAISRTLLSIRWPTLQGSEDVRFSMVYAILVGTSEAIIDEYATQWLVRASNLISCRSEIRRYATNGKKKVYVSNTREVSVEFQTW